MRWISSSTISPGKSASAQLGVGEAAQVRLRFEVETSRFAGRGKLPGKGSFPALTRPEQGSDRRSGRRDLEVVQVLDTQEHPRMIS